MQTESIYNLIPKEYVQPAKEPLYRSKFNPNIPPTASTFGHVTTSVPKVANVSGNTQEFAGPHPAKASTATMGKAKGTVKPQTDSFRKKGTGTMGFVYSPSKDSNFNYEHEYKKPAVPKKDEKPIMGLQSTKNYIVANAVENMLSQPKIIEQPTKYAEKKDFGKVPKYLENIKDQMNREYEHIKAVHIQDEEERDKEKFLMSEEELRILRDGLKKKWDIVNKEYQSITHIVKLDTVGLRRKKEECEKQLAQIEKDLDKLNKAYIFVDTTQ